MLWLQKEREPALATVAGREAEETGVSWHTVQQSGQSQRRCADTGSLERGVQFRKTTLLDVWRGEGPGGGKPVRR